MGDYTGFCELRGIEVPGQGCTRRGFNGRYCGLKSAAKQGNCTSSGFDIAGQTDDGMRQVLGHQWGSRQQVAALVGDRTYHQTFAMERKANRIRFKLANNNAAPVNIKSWAVASTNRLGAAAALYTPSAAWNVQPGFVIPARTGANDVPRQMWTDWVAIDELDELDGNLPTVMVRFTVSAGQTAFSNYSYAPWAATSGFNNGRYLFCYADDGDFSGAGTHVGFPGTVSNFYFAQGYEASVNSPVFNIYWQGDSITEGAVNGGGANYGNGHAFQTISLLRQRYSDIAFGYINGASAGSVSSTFISRYQEALARGMSYDAIVYSPFSPNDLPLTAGIIATDLTQLTQLRALDPTKPLIISTPCPNTTQAWGAATDALRTGLRTTLLNMRASHSGVWVFDMESLGDGASPARFNVGDTIDNTHPNEPGHYKAALLEAVQFEAVMRAIGVKV